MDKMYKSKDRMRSEREKLREMSFGEKVAYIWEYYKYYIIGGIAAIIAIIGISYSCATRETTGLFVAWSAIYLDHEEVDALKDKLDERISWKTSNETAEVSLFFTNDDDPAFAINYYNRLVAMLTARSIDVFILDVETLESYSSTEFIWPLDVVFDEIKSLNPAMFDIINNETVSTVFGLEVDNQSNEITGVRITDSPLLKRLGISTDTEIYFAMAITTQHIDRVAEALILFFE